MGCGQSQCGCKKISTLAMNILYDSGFFSGFLEGSHYTSIRSNRMNSETNLGTTLWKKFCIVEEQADVD